MTTYDWIVVGAGIVGSAMAYELAHTGFSVLLLDTSATSPNATRYSYGGVAYWAGDGDLSRQLCAESEAMYPLLSEELGQDIQFRELDMLLTVAPDRDPHAIAATHQGFRKPPVLLSPQEAQEMEPLLQGGAIAAAFHVRHGNVEPMALTRAYQFAFKQAGGTFAIESVQGFVREGDRIQGVTTAQHRYAAANVLVCVGGLSRALLQAAGVAVKVYFTHAELIETPPLDLQLQTIVMPAELSRMPLEAQATQPDQQLLWDEPGHELLPPILDAGVIQYADGVVRMGQVSRVLTDPGAPVDAIASEAQIRQAIGNLLPGFEAVPGQWAHCLVAFSGDRQPLVGALPGVEGLHICSGFNGPFLLAPPIARHFAQFHQGQPKAVTKAVMSTLSPSRFVATPD